MCLNINRKLTFWWKVKLFFLHSTTFYKRVVVRTGEDVLYGVRSEFNEHWWKQGWNTSNRQSKTHSFEERSFNQINEGMHVFTKGVKEHQKSDPYIEIKVRGYAHDLIAVGNGWGFDACDEAVFTKVWVSKKEWKRIEKEMERIQARQTMIKRIRNERDPVFAK